MKLRAIHTIFRMAGKKQVAVQSGDEFECPEAEAQEYIERGAAAAVDAPKKAPAKKAPAEKAPAEKAPAEKAPAEKAAEKGADENDDILGE